MPTELLTPEHYLETLPEDRQATINELRNTIRQNLPTGFTEIMSYGMIGYVVPLSLYPLGYHCNPQQPLPFISIASQKNFIAVYHMGLYAHPELLKWFQEEYAKQVKTKLDMGKSCIRFKKINQIPYKIIGELAAKVTPQQWIEIYESQVKR